MSTPPDNTIPTAPQVELLARPPLVMRRPLCLLGGRAYAAAWLDVRVTHPPQQDAQGKPRPNAASRVVEEKRVFIMRDDGMLFGEPASAPLSDLPFRVDLPEAPPPERCWSAEAVEAFRQGRRPQPLVLFGQMVEVLDTFMDFRRSLADQRTMTELLAAYALATWLLDAFQVIGYLWPNGDRGSDKTQCLLLMAELCHLGLVVQGGASFATLRDMADYGATLAFDDAEAFASPGRTDPDKRTLLLAGNRRGSVVSLKEPVGKGRWQTRHVNTFCPRLFSAIRLPDPVLASRTIILPMARTPDRRRANAEPFDFALWPHDRRRLVDHLWALAVTSLPGFAAGGYETRAAQQARLSGRELEPWRALLAVALWLDEQDKEGSLRRPLSPEGALAAPKSGWTTPVETRLGLFDRLEHLSWRYQEERRQLESDDLTRLVVRGLCRCAIRAGSVGWKGEPIPPAAEKTLRLTVNQVVTDALAVAMEEGWNVRESLVSPRRVARVLARLRLRQAPRAGGQGSRQWEVVVRDIAGMAQAYAVPCPELSREPPQPDASPASNGGGVSLPPGWYRG